MKYWISLDRENFKILMLKEQPRTTEEHHWVGPFETFTEVKDYGINYFVQDKQTAQNLINDLRYTPKKNLIYFK